MISLKYYNEQAGLADIDQRKPILKHTEAPDPTPTRGKLFLSHMSDLHQTFMISSLSSTNMISNVKDDHILQVSSQEPSTSSM